MSADNYEVIRRVPGQPGRYFVSCEFASDEEWPTDEKSWKWRRSRWKDNDGPDAEPPTMTLEEAQEYAHSEYSEYGVTYSFSTTTIDAVDSSLVTEYSGPLKAIVVVVTDNPGNIGEPGDWKCVFPITEEMTKDKRQMVAYLEQRVGELAAEAWRLGPLRPES